jgi:hypothetical protein
MRVWNGYVGVVVFVFYEPRPEGSGAFRWPGQDAQATEKQSEQESWLPQVIKLKG